MLLRSTKNKNASLGGHPLNLTMIGEGHNAEGPKVEHWGMVTA